MELCDKERNGNLAGGIDESVPLDLWHETSDEVRVKLGLPKSYLDVFELEREVVRGATFCMAGEEVVSDQANHFSIVDHRCYPPSEMRPPSPSIPEKEFVVEALKQGLRLDGRATLEMRQPTLTFGPDLGWVDCSLGETRYGFICVLLVQRGHLTLETEECSPRLRRRWSNHRRNDRLKDK